MNLIRWTKARGIVKQQIMEIENVSLFICYSMYVLKANFLMFLNRTMILTIHTTLLALIKYKSR